MDKTFFDPGMHYEDLKTLADYPDLYVVFGGHSLGVLTGNGMMSVQGVKVALGGEPGFGKQIEHWQAAFISRSRNLAVSRSAGVAFG